MLKDVLELEYKILLSVKTRAIEFSTIHTENKT